MREEKSSVRLSSELWPVRRAGQTLQFLFDANERHWDVYVRVLGQISVHDQVCAFDAVSHRRTRRGVRLER